MGGGGEHRPVAECNRLINFFKPHHSFENTLCMDLRLATLKAVSFYPLHNVSTLNQRTKFSCVTVVCKHFAGYQGYPD
jgi:hypothetical protein